MSTAFSNSASANRPFSFNRQGLQTRPLLYGLLLFRYMLGYHARLVPVQVQSSRSLHLKVWAVRDGGMILGFRNPLCVLVINKGRRSALIHLHLPTSSRALVQRLLAPKVSSTSGVTYGGQHLNRQVGWNGKAKRQTLRPTGNGSYVLWVRGYSAALLTVSVPNGTLAAPPQKAGPTPLFGYE